MSTVITVENLGKKYLLRHQSGQQPYVALRDVLNDGVRNLGRKLLGRGAAAARGAEQEEFWALRDVSFEVRQGDRIGIIGRNGAGKSTLLKILSRITEPTTGSVRIKGRVASLLEVGTGFHPELTGRENIYLNGAILGMGRAEIKKKFDEIVNFAEIEKFLDTPVKRYSSGMYVRLAFAVAAHLEPEILVVDEVLAVGDAQFQKKCLGKMEDVSTKEGRTVLFVSHNMGAVNKLCNRASWFEKGCLIQQGRSENIIDSYILSGESILSEQKHVAMPAARVALDRVWVSTENGDSAYDIDLSRSFKINIEFEVRKKVTDVDIGVYVTNIRNVPVFFTNLSVINNGEILCLEPGRYEAFFEVPSLLLVPDIYRVAVKAHVPYTTTEDHIPYAAEFRLVDTGSSMSYYAHDAWKYGVALGNFKWFFEAKF
jgi:lipopolysaccharide transport system ATP-binding protein